MDGAVAVNKVSELPVGQGLNAETLAYGDLLGAGVIDPVKVTRSAVAMTRRPDSRPPGHNSTVTLSICSPVLEHIIQLSLLSLRKDIQSSLGKTPVHRMHVPHRLSDAAF